MDSGLGSGTGTAVAAPPIIDKLLIQTSPVLANKDKSIHSLHGVIPYPFWYGGLASCVSCCCTQPLGVAGVGNSTDITYSYN
ncbi:hypothetical protein AAFC00_004414 [Neodothiora populina]|uniref:Uncharacterized protein n=1 Tax=Neodothiora populina TaxID=2781224 RepID=A0ABR3PPS9_9PEZI